MFLKEQQTGTLVQISDVESLFNPTHSTITGQIQAGQEEQPPREFSKSDLIFPSGETLPQCWLDANYRQAVGATPH